MYVRLLDAGFRRIQVIKAIRLLCDLPLKESYALVKAVPIDLPIIGSIPDALSELRRHGATVSSPMLKEEEFQIFMNGWDALLLQVQDSLTSTALEALTDPDVIEKASNTFMRIQRR